MKFFFLLLFPIIFYVLIFVVRYFIHFLLYSFALPVIGFWLLCQHFKNKEN